MGRDRTNSIVCGNFILHIDKDHLGYYRGQQAMSAKFRGWHYHIDSLNGITQVQIMQYLERVLVELYDAKKMESYYDLGIGVVEYKPSHLAYYKASYEGIEKTCVLWISSFNGKLHIEANKNREFAKGILLKDDLVRILKKWRIVEKLECFV